MLVKLFKELFGERSKVGDIVELSDNVVIVEAEIKPPVYEVEDEVVVETVIEQIESVVEETKPMVDSNLADGMTLESKGTNVDLSCLDSKKVEQQTIGLSYKNDDVFLKIIEDKMKPDVINRELTKLRLLKIKRITSIIEENRKKELVGMMTNH